MDRGAWQATVHRVTKSQTQLKQLSVHAHAHTHIYIHTWRAISLGNRESFTLN